MVQITVEAPEHIAKKFAEKKVVLFGDMIEEYEKGFEYERVNMKAGDFRNFLIKELSHD